MKYVYKIIAFLAVTFPSLAENAQKVPFERLLREMIDLKTLSEYPDPPFIAGRFSSCEASSPLDSVPAGFGNYDHGFYLDSLPEGLLMMDADGPGAITHIWSANSNGMLVFYLDSSATPSWTVPMKTLLDGSGEIPPPFSHIAARGENCYFPIPYKKHCSVFYSGTAPDIYYHIDYRTYPENTDLPTFDTLMLNDYAELIDSVATLLSDSTEAGRQETSDSVFSCSIEPGATVTAARLEGPGAISRLTFSSPDGFTPGFLRSCILEITFDGVSSPQIRLPLGDFFGSVNRYRSYWTLPVSITRNGIMTSRWYMPYRTNATVRLVNLGQETGSCSIGITGSSAEWTDNTMYFHARWRQDPAIIIDKHLYWNIYMASPLRTHPMIHITGKGVHVGTQLQIWNLKNAWWGEGDDKITIDDTPEQNILGTGTEDYFGYAWSTTDSFSHAYHAQPYSDGHNGFTVNSRFHISDPQPFTSSYRFDMEIQTTAMPTSIDFGRTVFFYALGTATTDHDTLTADDLFLREDLTVANRSPAPPPVVPVERPVPVRYDARRNMLIIPGDIALHDHAILRVFRADGRLVFTRSMEHPGFVSTSALSAGIYLADLSANHRTVRIRFLIGR